MKTLLTNAKVINEYQIFFADLVIEDGIIQKILKHSSSEYSDFRNNYNKAEYNIIDIAFDYLMPGMIDDQVHFRDPGLTHKADLETESKAAIAGGITSFMEMPNTVPKATTIELLEDKYDIAAKKSYANYSFYLGATNDNIEEVKRIDPARICGVKVFMGSSTGNMLVDDEESLAKIFKEAPSIITTHCEDEATINANVKIFKERHGEDLEIAYHPLIRNHEACYKSSSKAVALAEKYDARLHVLHISTADELKLFKNHLALPDKKITAEACVHHLWFTDKDYALKGAYIKWNPAIKTQGDRDSLLKAVLDDYIDVIATDHAPHTIDEKNNPYFTCPSGGPMVQHALNVLFEMHFQGKLTLEDIVHKTAHAPAILFKVEKRGFIREGYAADLTAFKIFRERGNFEAVTRDSLHYKCKWSPLEGQKFHSKITKTFVNGAKVYDNGTFLEEKFAQRLRFKS
jgi:dihydroorotase